MSVNRGGNTSEEKLHNVTYTIILILEDASIFWGFWISYPKMFGVHQTLSALVVANLLLK